MVDSTVSALAAATTLDGTELYYGVQAGADKKITGAQIKALAQSGVLPVANGGTGTSTPAIVAGSGITVAGTWPNQTVTATAGGGGTVTSVAVSGGTTGLTTSGGPVTGTGTITLAGTLAVANGGTGTTTPGIVAGTNITISGTWPNQTVNASGGGSIAPLVVESANVVAQRNAANAQTSYLYGTYTDASNYSRLKTTVTTGGVATISVEALGTGTGSDLVLQSAVNAVLRSGASGYNYIASPTQLQFSSGSAIFANFYNNNLNFISGWGIKFCSGSNPVTGFDTGLDRNAAGVLEVNNGTAGSFADIRAKNVRTNPTTVASLTAAATAGAGARSFVTDATSPTFGATVAGGGAVATPVYSDGTNWKVG